MALNSPQDEIDLLRDALDHIARIAGSARHPTKRLDWIAARAREAMRGIEWSREYLPEPRKIADQQTRDLHSALLMLMEACNTKNQDAITLAANETRLRFPSLFRERSDRDLRPPTETAQ
jgi:hypothetical protein